MVWNLLVFLTICSFEVSCAYEEPTPPIKDRTIILYLIANNNLESQGKILINEIEDFIIKEDNDSFNLVIIYRDRESIKLLSNGNQRLMLRKEYGNMNSLSKNQMTEIISDICKTFPAKEIGIAFWSHGTGWLPTGNNATRSFGDDYGESIDIYDLADSLSIKFDYIIFDACYMGGIEVASELLNSSKYYIASPTAVPTMGIIDTTSISILMQDCSLPDRLVRLCKHFYETKNFPIALIDLEQLDNLISTISLLKLDYNSFSVDDITKYEFRINDIFFDIYSLFKKINDCNVLLSLNRALLFPQNIEDDCYVSIFIPTKENKSYWNNYYTTSWNLQTGWLNKWQCYP